MSSVFFITHPEVDIDPAVRIEDWSLSHTGVSRMQKMLEHSWVAGIKSVYTSTEKKAIDGAQIVANHLSLDITPHERLGENNRSATGYLPKAEFESVADQFFSKPTESIRGWETAISAQHRIVSETQRILKTTPAEHPIAIVSHGAVGALLLCHLNGWPIDRKFDQPGDGGGNYYCFQKDSQRVIHGWRPIDTLPD